MQFLSDDDVLLFLLNRLEGAGQVFDFEFDRGHMDIISDPHDAIHVEADGLAGHGAHGIAETVLVLPALRGGEGEGARVPLDHVPQMTALRVVQPKVDIQMSSASHLEGDGHFVVDMKVFKEAVYLARGDVDRMREHACGQEKRPEKQDRPRGLHQSSP